MKRIHLVLMCTAAAGALFWAQATRAQVQVKQAPKDLATLVQSGQNKAAIEAIQAGADVNKAQPDGTSPLMWAVDLTEYEVAEALIAKKADVNVANAFGATPLTEAARQSNGRLVKMLLDAGAKVDSADPDGETALMMAISGGDIQVVQMLVSAGANVNTIEKFHNQTPLMYASAATRNAGPMVKLLLSKGADVKPRALYSDWPSQVTSEPRTQYRAVGGLTALLYAARGGCYECVEDLLAAGSDINKPTPEAITPLMIALDNSHNEVAKLLLDKGAKINVWDWWGRTALWIAVDRKPVAGAAGGGGGFGGGRGGGGGGRGGGRGGAGGGAPRGAAEAAPIRPAVSSMEIINALLNSGVDLNPEMNFHRPNAPGRGRFADNQISTATTPLFRAVQNNDLEAIQALLAKGADPNINTMGYTAFLMAAGAGPGGRGAPGGAPNMLVLDLMTSHGADVNAKVTGTQTWSFNVSRAPANTEGTSALHEAARSVRTELVKYLLDHGANPDILDADGKKPIDVIGRARAGRGGQPVVAAAAVQAELQALPQVPAGSGAPLPGRGAGAPGAGAPAAGAARGGAAPGAAAPGAGAPGAPGAGAARGGGARGGGARGGGGAPGGGANTAAVVAEIRTMLLAASANKK